MNASHNIKKTSSTQKGQIPRLQKGLVELIVPVSLSSEEMDRLSGGNTFREMERVLTFDKGYPHKS